MLVHNAGDFMEISNFVACIVSSRKGSPTLRRQYWRLLLLNSSNFFSSVQRTFIHCSTRQFLCLLAHSSRFTLFTARRRGFLTHTRPINPALNKIKRINWGEQLNAGLSFLNSLITSPGVIFLFASTIEIILFLTASETLRGRPDFLFGSKIPFLSALRTLLTVVGEQPTEAAMSVFDMFDAYFRAIILALSSLLRYGRHLC